MLTQNELISSSNVSIGTEESIDRVAKSIGLKLLDDEIDNLKTGDYVSLARHNLSELGTVFIFASALFEKASGKSKMSISFHDLPQINAKSKYRLGVPIHCWQDSENDWCLCLTVVGGEPAIFISG